MGIFSDFVSLFLGPAAIIKDEISWNSKVKQAKWNIRPSAVAVGNTVYYEYYRSIQMNYVMGLDYKGDPLPPKPEKYETEDDWRLRCLRKHIYSKFSPGIGIPTLHGTFTNTVCGRDGKLHVEVWYDESLDEDD